MSNFTNKSSNYFVTIFIGFIILSFMFTGYQSMQSSPNTVADVGDQKVSVTEYRQEYARQLDFYKGILGGKDLSTKQIQQFNIKANTLKNLIQRKLMLKFASQLETVPSSDEIKTEIKDLPYFKTNKQFDVNRYKALLSANRLTPTEFENSIRDQIKGRKASKIIQDFPVSKTYAQELYNFKMKKYHLNLISLNKEALRKFLPITATEIKTYLSVDANNARVKSIFNERKSSLGTPEKVLAQHILLKTNGKNDKEIEKKIKKIRKNLTVKNFSKMANKHTEDPSGKKNGGSLGLFARGKMVPDFEKIAFTLKENTISQPVKTNFGYHIILVKEKYPMALANLKTHQDKLAKELISKSKTAELDNLVKSIATEVKVALTKTDTKDLEKLRSKYLFVWQPKLEINQFDGAGSTSISDGNIQKIFKASNGKVLELNELTQTQLVIRSEFKAEKSAKAETLKDFTTSLQSDFAKNFSTAILKEIEDSITVKTHTNLL